MTLGAIGGDIRAGALFQRDGGVSDGDKFGKVGDIGLAQDRRIEKPQMVPGAELVIGDGAGISERAVQLVSSHSEDVLRAGAKKARAEAKETMALVREAVGMLPRSVG